jgi:hypothetical protein
MGNISGKIQKKWRFIARNIKVYIIYFYGGSKTLQTGNHGKFIGDKHPIM